MSIFFDTSGSLDIATSPSNLSSESADGRIVSGAMQRCKNFRLDQSGKITVRDGCNKLNSTALDQTEISELVEQAGRRYTFSGTKIYLDETSIATGLTDAPWSAILYNSYASETQAVFAVNGTDRKKIIGSNVYEWGIEAPTVAPTLAVGALAGLTGDYNAKYTYCRKEGTTVVCESNPSPAGAAAVTLANQSLSITWTASTDAQVTHVRVYKTLTGGSLYYHDTDVAIGTVTLDSNTADTGVGSEVATDHNRPPLGTVIAGPTYNGTCFMIKDNLLYFCKPKQPEYWPTSYYLEIGPIQFPGKSIVWHNGQGYYLTKHKIFYIQGTGYETFFPLPMESITGSQGRHAAVSIHGKGIYHVGTDGIYLYSGEDQNITQANFKPIFRGEITNGMPGVVDLEYSILKQFNNELWFAYCGKNGDFGYTYSWESTEYTGTGLQITIDDDTNLTSNIFTWEETFATATSNDGGYKGSVYDLYPQNAIVTNLDNNRPTYYSFPFEIRALTEDSQNKRLIAGGDSGYIWHLLNDDKDDDGGTDISWTVESMDYTLQTRRHYPRWIKYDVEASGGTVTGALILDGTVHQSHSVTGDRVTKRRLIATGNGRRCSIRLSGTGPVTIHAVEAE